MYITHILIPEPHWAILEECFRASHKQKKHFLEEMNVIQIFLQSVQGDLKNITTAQC